MSTRPLVPPPGAEEVLASPLDRHFAKLMVELHGVDSAELEWAAQLVSAWRGLGHTCVPLPDVAPGSFVAGLRGSSVIGAPGEFAPLILDEGDRLYLHRYWSYEDALARAIKRRLETPADIDGALLHTGITRFFGKADPADDQRRAAERAVKANFSVITGGPGTGKTRTVVVLLALLIEQFSARGKTARIALAAPTGKAGARLKESLRTTGDALKLPAAIRDALPTEATTLHRLLGVRPHSPYFRHDAEHPLAVDIVIVDEASMVDLALMAKLFAAVPPSARLILLGDKDQLASVEAGYVLGDICRASEEGDSQLAEHITELRTNHRFAPDSGIYQLSQAVNAGDTRGALKLLSTEPGGDIIGTSLPAASGLGAALRERVLAGYSRYLDAATPAEALTALNEFRILAALRKGPFGVENLNRLVEEILSEHGLIQPHSSFYHGRPVLIRENEPQLRLFNGDIGLLLRDPESGHELRAFFLDAEGTLRRLLPARLPAHETGFAMTVHKSQGSEFRQVLFVLPEHEHAVCTRELLYTGLTRARDRVELWWREPALRAAIERRTVRTSGLGSKM